MMLRRNMKNVSILFMLMVYDACSWALRGLNSAPETGA